MVTKEHDQYFQHLLVNPHDQALPGLQQEQTWNPYYGILPNEADSELTSPSLQGCIRDISPFHLVSRVVIQDRVSAMAAQ